MARGARPSPGTADKNEKIWAGRGPCYCLAAHFIKETPKAFNLPENS